MKYNIDEAISILQDFVETDRIIRDVRDNSIESDYDIYCERNDNAIESLIEYVYASQSELKASSNTNDSKQLTDEEIKQLIVCLDSAIYCEDEFISHKQKCKLIKYNDDTRHRLYELLGIEHWEGKQSIDIDTLEIKCDKL